MNRTTPEPPKLVAETPTLKAVFSREITRACSTVLGYLIDGTGSAEQTIQQVRHLNREERTKTLTESFGLMFGKLAEFRDAMIQFEKGSRTEVTKGSTDTLFREVAFRDWQRDVRVEPRQQIDAIVERIDQLFQAGRNAGESDPSLKSLAERAYINALSSFVDSLSEGYVASGYMQRMLQVAVTRGNEFNSGVVNSHSAGFPLLGREPEATAMLDLFQKAREKLSFPEGNPQKLQQEIDTSGHLVHTLQQIKAGGYNRSSH